MAATFSTTVARPRDEAAVSALLQASYSTLMRDSYDDAVLAAALPSMTRAKPALLAAGTFYLARTADGGVVGCGGWSANRPDGGGTPPTLGHIRHFATHPDWLGRGIGRALYDLCETAARAAGLRQFDVYASLNGEGFYAALGFQRVRWIEVRIGNGALVPTVLMQRAI